MVFCYIAFIPCFFWYWLTCVVPGKGLLNRLLLLLLSPQKQLCSMKYFKGCKLQGFLFILYFKFHAAFGALISQHTRNHCSHVQGFLPLHWLFAAQVLFICASLLLY